VTKLPPSLNFFSFSLLLAQAAGLPFNELHMATSSASGAIKTFPGVGTAMASCDAIRGKFCCVENGTQKTNFLQFLTKKVKGIGVDR
jgi:hypothetical protein